MGTIVDKLNYLNDTKQAIKQAIIDKGVSVADTDTFRSYVNKILSIQSGTTPDYEKLAWSSATGLKCENLVLNNFSSGVYAYIDKAFLPSSSPWEIVIKATLPTLGTHMSLTGGYDNYFYFPELDITSAGKFQCCISYSGSGWGAYLVGTTVLSGNTTYWFKLEFTGTAYNSYLSIDGVNYALEATTSTTSTIYQNGSYTKACLGASSRTQPFTGGRIDLKESYMKINNELFWGVKNG